MSSAIEPGDHVTFGSGTVHWEVLSVTGTQHPAYRLRSGQTGRIISGVFDGLKIHTKAARVVEMLAITR